uniref:Nucleoredoxin-like protein 2 n=1 Tax=Hadrurus spadix TaxID=141984 RepID=A0A1W7RA19_9SCOR
MEYIKGKTLVKKDKTEVGADESLADVEIVGFYFSAHWCPPCRAFTPVLADAYEEMKESGSKFEVVFVTSDRDEQSMYDYMKECHGDWLAVPFGSETIRDLKQKYSVTGIPTLVIVKKDGTLITKDGRSAVQSNGAQAYKSWVK